MKARTLVVPLIVTAIVASGDQPKTKVIDRKASAPENLEPAHLIGAGPVVVPDQVLEGWRFLYRFVTEVEFVLCLEGRKNGDKVQVDGFRLAYMEASNSSSVRYQPCVGEQYIGTAHNHPPVTTARSLCYQSLPDRRSFEADTRAIVDIVLCGEDRFLWVVRTPDGEQRAGEAVVLPSSEGTPRN